MPGLGGGVPDVGEPVRYLQDTWPFRVEPLLFQRGLDLRACQRQRDKLVAERLCREHVAVAHRAVRAAEDVGANAAGIGEGDHRAGRFRRRQMGIRDDIAERAFAGGHVRYARQRFGQRSGRPRRDRRGDLVIGCEQSGLGGIGRVGRGVHDEVIGLGADHVAGRAVELEVDRGDDGAVFVAGGDEAAVDLAGIGAVGVAADHDIDGAIELLDDIDDRPGDARAFIVVAGRIAAFVDQHHDRRDAARLQLRHQRVDGVRLVPEFQAGDAGRRHQRRRGFQRQPDEADRDAVENLDLVGRQQRPSGRGLDGAGREIAKRRAHEGMRTAAAVDRMAAAILHAQQLVAAFVEFVVADRGDLQPHHRQRLDGRLVVKHR